jgi:O-antigen/teichoic acid export membrane protein
MSMTAPRDATAPSSDVSGGALDADIQLATRSAMHLGVGLIGSWAIGIAIRLLLPRWLGPEQFGVLQFADVFTTTLLIVTMLGADTYIRKEVGTRPQHASEFFGGTLLIGLCVGALALAIALPSLAAAGKPSTVLWIVAWLAVAQMVVNINNLYAALLHSVGAVRGLAGLNVAGKLLWAVGIVIALRTGAGLVGVAQAMLFSELVRCAVLYRLGRRHLSLRLRVDLTATRAMVLASLPFFIGGVAQTIYARIDVSILSFLASDAETGWYGAASTIAGLSLLLSPIISWVLLPLSSRAAARSEAELMHVMRRAMSLVLTIAVPASLGIWVAADLLIVGAFGEAFRPAMHSLRIIAPTFLLTYTAMVSASLLVRLERAWTVTIISLLGMIVSPSLNFVLVPRFAALYGVGGAGMGAAWALTLTELFTAGTMTWQLGSRAFDRQSVSLIGKTMLLALGVAAADLVMRRFGYWRIPIDVALYLGIGTLWKIIDPMALMSMARGTMPPALVAERAA